MIVSDAGVTLCVMGGLSVWHLLFLLIVVLVVAAVVAGVVWLVSKPGRSSRAWTPEQRDRQ